MKDLGIKSHLGTEGWMWEMPGMKSPLKRSAGGWEEKDLGMKSHLGTEGWMWSTKVPGLKSPLKRSTGEGEMSIQKPPSTMKKANFGTKTIKEDLIPETTAKLGIKNT